MTTMDAAAARRQPRVALAVIMALAGINLAGCETSTSLFGSNTPAPQEAPAPIAQQPALAKVAVAPIIGAPDAVAKQIHQDFSSLIEKQRVSVSTAKDERVDYTLRGYIVAAKEKNATKVSYIWDVTDPAGKRVDRITGEEVITGNASKDPWAAVSPAVGQSIATKAANTFGTWLSNQTKQPAVASSAAAHPAGVGVQTAAATTAPATAPPEAAKQSGPATAAAAPPAMAPAASAPETTTSSIARDGAVAAVVPVIKGAPGDGSTSLAAAIRQELSSKGVSVSEKPTTVAYRIEGTVTMGQANGGKQPIQIEWLVRDPQGKKLGTVSQKNEIPEGSLDGAWGATANQAAGAAAQGILKLLPQSKSVN